MENCIFCKIVAKQIPATVLYEDEDFLAFNDINPIAPVHFLIIPKKHIDSLSHANVAESALLGKMLSLAPKLAEQEGCGLVEDAEGNRSGGYKTQINTGPAGGQLVYHLHAHVIGGRK
ncbi:MAG: histidine triad nucleotide-binding protein [Burkholderiales bacterium]|nr:histidine triad nucleotide-binding protein [Burkholderiales bacterium]